MLSAILCRLLTLTFGTAYPAYASFKAVKTKNAREYVRWMMYWIVFAVYNFVEIFADIFLGFWFPLYDELKFFLVLWLIFPNSKVPSFVYRSFIHPHLSRHEEQIDAHIERIWDHCYAAFRQLGSHSANYLLDATVQLVQKGQITVATQLPRILDLPQGVPSVENSAVLSAGPVHEVDRNSGDYEDFDMVSLETELLTNHETDSSAQGRPNFLPESRPDSDPNAEDEISEESHHSRLRRRQAHPKSRDTSAESGPSSSRNGKSRQKKTVKK